MKFTLVTLLLCISLSSCKKSEEDGNIFSANHVAYSLDAELFHFLLPELDSPSDRFALESYNDQGVLESKELPDHFVAGDRVMVIIQKEPYRFVITKKGASSTLVLELGKSTLQMWDTYDKNTPLSIGQCFAAFSEDSECSMPPMDNDIGLRLAKTSK